MKLKTVFHVEVADTKEVIVEKSQLEFEVTEHADRFSIVNLARDHKEELLAMLDPIAGPVLSDELKNKFQKINLDENYIDEILMCQGDLMWHFIRLKLREWAQKQIADQA